MFIPVRLGSNSHHRDVLIHSPCIGHAGGTVVRERDTIHTSGATGELESLKNNINFKNYNLQVHVNTSKTVSQIKKKSIRKSDGFYSTFSTNEL